MEGLRIMPPVPVTAREAAKTDYIDGVLVPKGTLIYIPVRHSFNLWAQALLTQLPSDPRHEFLQGLVGRRRR